jgi:hypothetical protein
MERIQCIGSLSTYGRTARRFCGRWVYTRRSAFVMELYDELEGLLGWNGDGKPEARESAPAPMASCGR